MDNYLQILMDSLIKKRDILGKLILLSEEQKVIVGEVEFDDKAFQKNVDAKDELIQQMLKMDEGFDLVFGRVKEQLSDKKEQYAEEIKVMQGLIREVTELAARVETQENRNKDLITAKFSQMRKEVQNAKRSTQMANKYYKSMNKIDFEPQFMDQKK